ncbi:MAG: DUF4834 family protein [Rikenellaceae bacterium]
MDGFISFIIYFVIGFYLLGFVGRILFRLWLRRIQKRYQQNPQGANFRSYTWGFGQQQQQQEQEQNKKEGEVTVKAQEKQKRVNKDIGEYVDFEEIKDTNDTH